MIPGYKPIEELSRTEWYVLYRAEQVEDGATVLVKVPRRQPPQASDVNLFAREFELLRRISVAGVSPVSGLPPRDGKCLLVLQDPGGMPLSQHLRSQPSDLDAFFGVAIPLAAVVTALHRLGLICRGLSPQSILVNLPAGTILLADLSLVTPESGGSQSNLPLYFPRSLLPYMSPEETGRMNRTVDHRTDFYSLGAIFYELLTGAPPFRSEDALELIHSHIARLPQSPVEVNREIPPPLSDLVMKLLAKTAEERYQSGPGIQEDLAHCRREWQVRRWIAPFSLGRQDVSDRFLIPKKLYGREQEVTRLLQAFDLACEGPAVMMLVSGYSGIGKTSLIQELYQPIVLQKGYFISGKFDQVGRNVPFGALIQAFRGLARQLLTESEERLSLWSEQLGAALGANGGVLTEVIPEIELIIGKQPTPPVLGPTEALNRFQLVFQNFVGALAQRDHPLVVFLDDLQWADSATLSLLQPLLTTQEVQFLFLIGAYRDNEVDAGHPLARTLSALEAAGARLRHTSLGPLELPDLTLFIRDTLQGELSDAEPLACLVLEKTGGNPFFVIQFLRMLKESGFVEFQHQEGRWVCEMEAVRRAGMTDNVIDLMTQRIRRLSPESQQILTLAACIGNSFDLETLAVVSQQTAELAQDNLRAALEEGLVLPTNALYPDNSDQGLVPTMPACPAFVFLHDRVQQAAYALVPDQQKPLVHRTVGRLLLDRWDAATTEEKVFDVVHHLNLGSSLITDEPERLNLIRLNLSAGRKAKASTAYRVALGYLEAGLHLVSEAWWNSHYDLMLALHLEAAECKCLCRRFEDADRDFDKLLKRVHNPMDRARVYALRVLEYESLARYATAVECGRDALALFQVTFPTSSEAKQAALEHELSDIQSLLEGRSIDELIHLPAMTDPEHRMVMNLLTLIWSSAYISGDQVLTRLISATMVRLSLEYGNTEESAYGYATHTVTVGPIKGDYRSAYAWGELALRVNERFNDQRGRAKIHQQFHAHANYWRRPFQTCVPHSREASRSGLETGDFAYAGYGAFTECWHTLLVTRHLEEFVNDCSASLALLEKLKISSLVPTQTSIQKWARALQGHTANPTSFSEEGFDEEEFIQTYGDHPFRVVYLYVLKVHLCLLFEEFEPARKAARVARGMIDHLIGTIWPVYLDLFEGLLLIAGWRVTNHDYEATVTEIERIERSFSVLAENCPENFRCGALLLKAGLEDIRGKASEAMEAYEQAVQYARETRNLHNEALACEQYGAFWQQRGNPEIAGLYLRKARQCFLDWGATAKARHLEKKLSHLMSESLTVEVPESTVMAEGRDARNRNEAFSATGSFDIATVTKAARAIAVEIVLDDLLRRLMKIALENAGAQRGLFLQETEGRLFVVAEGHAEEEEVHVFKPISVEGSRSLSPAVVHYVQKTGESLVIADAISDHRFLGDPYIATLKPKSILCVPVINQGKLSGILYLENNLAANAFTAERIEVMRILSSQAAISLENARLYDEMRQEAEQRQKAEEMLRSITEGTAAVTGTDFFRSLVRHLATALQVRYAFVTECQSGDSVRASMLALWTGQSFGDNYDYDVAPTPCGKVLQGEVCFFGEDLQLLFPDDLDLTQLEAQSFLGVPMFSAVGVVIGHIAVLDDKPMTENAQKTAVLRIFAARAAAELERLRAEGRLRTALAEVESLKNRLHAENIYLQEEIRSEHNFEEIVGSSPALIALLRQVEQVAPTDSSVLIFGETGTGKELIARAIHNRSARLQRPLVKVNCGAISAGLVESELFGHVKGAFTGAIESRTGRFQLADGGTLFLDEVGELPPDTQVKLLRVLQEQEFEPVGSSRTLHVDVRIIAASNRNLAELVTAGKFRSDLFYRLNVFPLTVPPLRERRRDIPQLVMFFLDRFSRKIAKRISTVSQDAMNLLVDYSWPGNVRELQSVIQRAIVLSSGPVLNFRDLSPALSPDPAVLAVAAEPGSEAAGIKLKSLSAAQPPVPAAPTLQAVERDHILSVLEKTNGLIEGPKGAARILNIHPNTLRSRMKKLGIQRLGRSLSQPHDDSAVS
ncbi:MAG: sigma 54-interacting transcriptional regulator [Acidobacteriota bacterium]